jgi:hypothetical protein
MYLCLFFSKTGNARLAKAAQVAIASKAMFEILKNGKLHNVSIRSSLSASTVSNPTISLFSQKDSRPLRKIENKKVEMVTPCFTPLQHGKKFDG